MRAITFIRRYGLFGLATVAMTFIVVVPLAIVVLQGFISPVRGSWQLTLSHLTLVLTRWPYWAALFNTFVIGLGATAVACAAGIPMAWLFARTNLPGKGLLEKLATIPIFIPPFVGAVAWILLAAPRIGAFNYPFRALMGLELLNVYTLTGISWVIGIYLAPYVMMIVGAALRSMDPSLEEAAQVSGLSRFRTAVTVTLPLVAPAILSGAVLAFIITIGLFGTPVVIGWARQLYFITSRIYLASQEVPPAFGVMAILAIYLILLSLLATMLQRWLIKGRSFVTVSGKGFRARPIVLGRSRWFAAGFVWLYCFFTIVAPIIVLIGAAFSTFTWSGRFTMENFEYLWTSQDVRITLQNSLLIALIAATISTILGIVISWTTQRTTIPNRQILEYLAVLPVSVPGIAFGVGVALFWLRMPIAIYGTIWIIVLAFIGRFTGYAVRSISSSIVQVHPELEESARIAGYGWIRTFTRITLPLIRPSIVASWMLLFSIFITELSMVVLLYTANTRMFSVLSFEVWNAGNFSQVASLSLLQLVVGVVVLQTVQLLWPQRNVHG
jgi:iron(III) transport system permease protein